MISILIIDDHPIVLKGTKILFDDIPNMNVEIENHPKNVLSTIVNKQYDVYVIDINMTEKNGLQLASEIKMYQANSKIILYTGEDIHPYYPLILEKKIDGLVSKTAPYERIVQTIRSVIQDEYLLPSDFIEYVNQKIKNKSNKLQLNFKEKQLVTLLLANYTNKMIAEEFNVTQRTAERYLTQLFTILDVSSRQEAIRVVQEKGLL
ncbi:DNA-binding response regulator [Solibacillus silvestris]|nr:response regulator transcription factor [Solibacillus silvestris]OBW55861.1 DNA-binding response regulator [Solibacillus silvestris]